jgi:hypothetical protein
MMIALLLNLVIFIIFLALIVYVMKLLSLPPLWIVLKSFLLYKSNDIKTIVEESKPALKPKEGAKEPTEYIRGIEFDEEKL